MEPDRHTPAESLTSYTPEEMMSRLKKAAQKKHSSGPSKEGTLVTRKDGSQAIKVRRRRRRSPKLKMRQKKKSPAAKWAALGSLAGCTALLTAATIFIITKYNGASFKAETENQIASISDANQVEITQLSITPISAKAQKVALTWSPHHFLHTASFHQLSGDLLATSFVTSTWTGEEIVASLGDVYMQTPAASEEKNDTPAASPYQFGSLRCNQLNLHFGTSKEAPTIAGMTASLWTMPNGRSQLIFNNGRVIITGWPELAISSGIATLNSNDVEVEALLQAGEVHNGELKIKGHIHKDINNPIELDVKAKSYPIQELLGPSLGRLIRGEISSESGSLQYHYKQPTQHALSFTMPFSSSDIRMMEFPLFTKIKDITGDTQYIRPSFNHCRGTLKRTNKGVTIDDIDFKSTSVMTLSGKISVDHDGEMSGDLVVGLPRRLFDPAKIPHGFTGPRDGLYSAKVTVSGTVHNPYDNLAELLKHEDAQDTTKPDQAPPNPTNTPPLPPTQPSAPTAPIDKETEFEQLLR